MASKSKAQIEGQAKAPPAQAVQRKPETPEKVAGPLRAGGGLMTANASPPPPNGGPSGHKPGAMRSNLPGINRASPGTHPGNPKMGQLGNAPLSRLPAPHIQAKLTVNTPGDVYEQEADRVADQVMRMPEPGVTRHASPAPVSAIQPLRIQRMCPQCGSEMNTPVARVDSLCQECQGRAQRQEGEAVGTPEVSPELESRLASNRGNGQPLSGDLRSSMEPRFGQDFSGVRIHTDGQADEAARELNAQAFTSGQDIYFGQGRYKPGTPDGKRLLAHELTHTVQQGTRQSPSHSRGINRQPDVQPESGFDDSGGGMLSPAQAQSTNQPQSDLIDDAASPSTGQDFLGVEQSPTREQKVVSPLPSATAETAGETKEPGESPSNDMHSADKANQTQSMTGVAEQITATRIEQSSPDSNSSESKAKTSVALPMGGPLTDNEPGSEPRETSGKSPSATREPEMAGSARGEVESGSDRQAVNATSTLNSHVRTSDNPDGGGATATRHIAGEAPLEKAEDSTALVGPTGPGNGGSGSQEAGTGQLDTVVETPAESEEYQEDGSQTQQENEPYTDGPSAISSFLTRESTSLEKEATTAAQGNSKNRDEEEQASRPPDIQRNLWSDIKSTVGRGVNWVTQNVIQPVQGLISTGWSTINEMGDRLTDAYRQANANGWDILQFNYLLFRITRNLRRQLYRDAIEQQEREQARAVAEGRLTPEAAAEPTLLERADSLAETLEGAGETVFEVQREIVEGAILGDFKENPTIWNTIGQIAVGFVPYAGQVADIRDLIASINKLHNSGWKDPWEWFNLVLVAIGFIPGIGDAIKAVGRGAKGAIRRGVRWVMGHASRLWRSIARRIPGLLRGAARLGRRLLDGARQLGRRLVQGAHNLGRRVIDAARGVVQGIRRLIGRVSSSVRRLASGIANRARSLVSRARGLIGRVVGGVTGAVRRALGAARSVATRAANLVRRAMTRGRQIIDGLRRRITEATRRAANFLRESIRGAIQRGRVWLRSTRERASRAIRNAYSRGRQLASQGYNWTRNLIRRGINWVRHTAIRWIRNGLRTLKERLLNYLRRIYYRITRTRPSQAPYPGHTPGGRRTTIGATEDAATRRSLMRENDSADALSRAGYNVEQNPVVPGAKNPDYRIEGRIFDNYAPSTSNPRNIWSEIQNAKINTGQADRIILNLEDSAVDINALRRQFRDWPMPGLKEVIVVRGGRVTPFWP